MKKTDRHAYIHWIKHGWVLLATVTLLTACGAQLFESIMFAPARPLPQDAKPCDYLPAGDSCEALNPQEVFFSSADNKTRLQALLFKNPQSKLLLIYFHGNAGHVYNRMRFAVPLVDIANVLILSYRGYGKSAGSASEAGLYEDAKASIAYASTAKPQGLGFKQSQIYLYGRSLGGAVAIYVAQQQSLSGIILISTFSSGYDLAVDRHLAWVPGLGQPFPSIQYLENIDTPMLFVHGDRDTLVPIEHGIRLYEQYKHEKDFHVVRGATHNDIHRIGGDVLWQRIKDFVHQQQAKSAN